MKAGLYARVSTHDQHTLTMQIEALKSYADQRGWVIVLQVEEVGSGASTRPKREQVIRAACRREIDVVLVWKLDRWGRSQSDLITTLQELEAQGVGFVSFTEALDFTTPIGKAMLGMLATFAEFERSLLQERIKSGIAHARSKGKPHGRPKIPDHVREKVQELGAGGFSKAGIARQLKISRPSVISILSEARTAVF